MRSRRCGRAGAGAQSVLCERESQSACIKRAAHLAETAGRQPHFCSSALWVWRDGCWLEYTFEAGTGEAMKQRRIAGTIASDYDHQKGLLDQTQNKDIYVAQFMVYLRHNDPGLGHQRHAAAGGRSAHLRRTRSSIPKPACPRKRPVRSCRSPGRTPWPSPAICLSPFQSSTLRDTGLWAFRMPTRGADCEPRLARFAIALNQHIRRVITWPGLWETQRDGSSAHESEAQSRFVGHGSSLFSVREDLAAPFRPR
jgi:hypothetical protein